MDFQYSFFLSPPLSYLNKTFYTNIPLYLIIVLNILSVLLYGWKNGHGMKIVLITKVGFGRTFFLLDSLDVLFIRLEIIGLEKIGMFENGRTSFLLDCTDVLFIRLEIIG